MVVYLKYIPSKQEIIAEMKAALAEEDEAMDDAKRRNNLPVASLEGSNLEQPLVP